MDNFTNENRIIRHWNSVSLIILIRNVQHSQQLMDQEVIIKRTDNLHYR